MTKAKKISYWIATIWLSLGMVSTGIAQLLQKKTGAGGVDSVTHLGYPVYFLTILGVWKILGSIAVLVPKFPVVKEWAYAGFFFAMSGAVISHFIMGSGFVEIAPSILLLALTVLSWYLRPDSRKLIPQTK